MDGNGILNEIVSFLLENEEALLKDAQYKVCGPCGGGRVDVVYRNPESYQLGRMLDVYRQGTRSGQST